MDDAQQARSSDAAATRKRRSSILKSQRPARTPFSELEFNVATPTDTAKSRRVSFSRRTGVAEFITHEATTTWKNFYEEHNKSLESSGNESDMKASRQSVGHLGKRIFDQQFEEVEVVDLIGSLNPSMTSNVSLNSINFKEQMVSLDCTSEQKLTAPQSNFDLSALTAGPTQSKIFGNDFTVTGIGEMSGRIAVNFSAMQEIGGQDDLDEIERDLDRIHNVVCQGPKDPNVSEYIEVDLNMTQLVKSDECDMSITDGIPSPKVQDICKKYSANIKDDVRKDWVADKENIAINPYAAPCEADNFAINENPDQLLVYDGKKLVLEKEEDYKKRLLPKESSTKTPQRKTIVLNINDDLPNFGEELNSKSQNDILRDDDFLLVKNDVEMESKLNINSEEQQLIRKSSANSVENQQNFQEVESYNISITQALPGKIITETIKPTECSLPKELNDYTCNLSMTQALPSNIIQNDNHESPSNCSIGMEEISFTQVVPSNILDQENSQSTNSEKGTYNMSMTQALPVKIITRRTNSIDHRKSGGHGINTCNLSTNRVLTSHNVQNYNSEENVSESLHQVASSNYVLNKKCTEKRNTIIFNESNGNISITRSLPANIVMDMKSQDKNKTLIFEDTKNDLSLTQIAPSSSILKRNSVDRRQSVAEESGTCNLSFTQVLPTNIIQNDNPEENISQNEILHEIAATNVVLNKTCTEKRNTIIFNESNGNISITRSLPANIVLDMKSQDKNKTSIFEDTKNDLSLTQIAPSSSILKRNSVDRRQSVAEESGTCNLSFTQVLPTNIIQNDNPEEFVSQKEFLHQVASSNVVLNKTCTEKRNTIIFNESNGNISITRSLPANIVMDMKSQDKNKTLIFEETKNDLSLTQIAPSSSILKRNSVDRRQSVAEESGTCNLKFTQVLPTNIIQNDNPEENVSQNEFLHQVASSNVVLNKKCTEKRNTMIFHESNGNISITRSLPANIVMDVQSQDKNKTLIFDGTKNNLSLTQIAPSSSIIKRNLDDYPQSVAEENRTCNLSFPTNIIQKDSVEDIDTLKSLPLSNTQSESSITKIISTNSALEQKCIKEHNTIILDDANISLTQPLSVKIVMDEKLEGKHENIVFEDGTMENKSIPRAHDKDGSILCSQLGVTQGCNDYDMSQHIEKALSMAQSLRSDKCGNVSIIDDIGTLLHKVADIKKCSMDVKQSTTKDWITDKENIAINPCVVSYTVEKSPLDEEAKQVLVFDGKTLILEPDENEKIFEDTSNFVIPPNISQTKSTILNIDNDVTCCPDDLNLVSEECSSNNFNESSLLTLNNKPVSIYKDNSANDIDELLSYQELPSNTGRENCQNNISDQQIPESDLKESAAKSTTEKSKIYEFPQKIEEMECCDVSITCSLTSNTSQNEDFNESVQFEMLVHNDIERTSPVKDVLTNLLKEKVVEKHKTVVFEGENVNHCQSKPINIVADTQHHTKDLFLSREGTTENFADEEAAVIVGHPANMSPATNSDKYYVSITEANHTTVGQDGSAGRGSLDLTLPHTDAVMNTDGAPLKKTAFGETSYMRQYTRNSRDGNKSNVIPTYDITDGIKELMSDLVKPLADVLPYHADNEQKKKEIMSSVNRELQADLASSSQIDMDINTTSEQTSHCDMRGASSFFSEQTDRRLTVSDTADILRPNRDAKLPREATDEKILFSNVQKIDKVPETFDQSHNNTHVQQPRDDPVLIFDHENPLNNVLLLPLNDTRAHKYDPIHVTVPQLIQSNDTLNRSTCSQSCQIDSDNIVGVESGSNFAVSAYCNYETRRSQNHQESLIDTASTNIQSISGGIRPSSKDCSVDVYIADVKNIDVNTLIAMKGNKELLEASSSLTLIQEPLTPETKTPSSIETDVTKSGTKSLFEIKYQESSNMEIQSIPETESDTTFHEEDMTSLNKAQKRAHKPSTPLKNSPRSTEVTPKPQSKIQKLSISPKVEYMQFTPDRTEADIYSNRVVIHQSDSTEQKKSLSPRSPKKHHRIDRSMTVQQLITEYSITDKLNESMFDKQVLKALRGPKSLESEKSGKTGSVRFPPAAVLECSSSEVVSSFTSSKNLKVAGAPSSLRSPSTVASLQSSGMDLLPDVPNLTTQDDCDSGVNVVAKIDMLPFMGSHECEWDSSSSCVDTWCFRLLHGRVRLSVRLEHRHGNATRTIVRGDTQVVGIEVETVQPENKHPVASVCVRFVHDTLSYVVRGGGGGGRGGRARRARDVPALLRRAAGVARAALRWGRAMLDAKLHLAYTLDHSGRLALKVANIPLRSVWEVRMTLELCVDDGGETPWPRACDVRVASVLPDGDVADHELQRVLEHMPRDWGHVPRTLWRIFKYLKHKKQDNLLVGT